MDGTQGLGPCIPEVLPIGAPSVPSEGCLVPLCPTGDRVPLHFPESSNLGWAPGLLLWEEVVLSSFFVPALERQTHELTMLLIWKSVLQKVPAEDHAR